MMMDSPSAEDTEVDELNNLVNAVRKTRITIGFTQSEMARSISALCGKKISQTTVCRFEGKILPQRNLRRLRPICEQWIQLGRKDPKSVREASFRQPIRRTQRAWNGIFSNLHWVGSRIQIAILEIIIFWMFNTVFLSVNYDNRTKFTVFTVHTVWLICRARSLQPRFDRRLPSTFC